MALEPQVRSVVQQNSSAVDLVTAEIRRAVLTGALAPGQEFSVRALAGQLGVSHIPVREALRRLETQGLIILRQARSATVATLTIDDLEAIYRLRYAVEVPLAAASVGQQSADQVDNLEWLLERSRDLDPEVAWRGHYDFHAALIEPAASEWDERVLQTLWMAAERYTHLVFDPTHITDAERQRRYEAHRLLLDLSLEGDPESMVKALTSHLGANEDSIREHLRQLEAREVISA